MRFKLELSFDFNTYGNKLPASYQYELSAWIYQTLAKSNAAYTKWLHTNGFTKDEKQFRLFVFSNLQIAKLRANGDRLELQSDSALLYLSILPEQTTAEFINGIFLSESFALGDRHSRVQCSVKSVELMDAPQFTTTMTFATLSPMALSDHLPNGNSTYVEPTEASIHAIYRNLCAKYEAYYGTPFSESPIGRSPLPSDDLRFTLLGTTKRKKITIKSGTPQQTYIVGYITRFRITLPLPLMQLLYETGVGEKGSMGFGMVEEI